MLNILKNAAEAFERPGGHVHIEFRHDEKAATVEIRDDGPGILAENSSDLFEPFFTTKAAGHGTGLGLSISRQVIEEHGGALTVASEPGKGAAFTIELPLESRHAS